MKTFCYSLIAALLIFSCLSAVPEKRKNLSKRSDKVINLDSSTVSNINQGIPIQIVLPDATSSDTGNDIVRYVVSLFGGILTAIVIKILHHWWPKIFPDSSDESGKIT